MKQPMNKPILVTAGLPYANGSIHIGHLLEYLSTDIYVRALRMAGEEAYYFCADDTHGTPIEVNAAKAGVTPEQFIARFAKEHLEDFTAFGIRFDHYDSTNSDENRQWALQVYGALKKGGYIKKRPLTQLYDEQARRFLPDRFVKGTCPKCGAADQYGDVCEVCSSTYEPTDLKDPYSTISGSKPVLRESTHLFVDLAAFQELLRSFVDRPGLLGSETKNFVDSWLEQGLRDWCISRDAPYFGFEIPDEPGKFFYVWLDAPIGYIASSTAYAKKIGKPELIDRWWREDGASVVHVIGKDIRYFHILFWPAMLHAARLTLPSRIQVHGMLTVDGVKMSKSRGTFINASTFRQHLDPTYLRYYFASKAGPGAEDVDLALEEFVNRVNAELVNNLANLVARGVPFLKDRLGGRYGRLPADAEAARKLVADKAAEAERAYRNFDLAAAVRAVVEIGAAANKLFQDGQPWRLVKDDPEAARGLVTLCLNMARAATALIHPAVPAFGAKVYPMLGLPGEPERFSEALAFDLVDRPVGEPGRIIDRIERKQLDAIIEASRPKDAPAAPEKKAAPPPKAAPPAAPQAAIEKGDFDKVDLRVGLVLAAQAVEGSDKLLQLSVDLGEDKPRTIFAGIRSAYGPEALLGRRVVVVANLKPRKMRFGTSEGMILAAGPGDKEIWLLAVPDDAPPGSKIG
jgi:methionyl-tRNA synthetase